MSRLDWLDDALCSQVGDVEAFYNSTGTPERWVVQLCARCPVRIPCLEHTMSFESGGKNSRFGYSGGMTPIARARLDKRQQRGAA